MEHAKRLSSFLDAKGQPGLVVQVHNEKARAMGVDDLIRAVTSELASLDILKPEQIDEAEGVRYGDVYVPCGKLEGLNKVLGPEIEVVWTYDLALSIERRMQGWRHLEKFLTTPTKINAGGLELADASVSR